MWHVSVVSSAFPLFKMQPKQLLENETQPGYISRNLLATPRSVSQFVLNWMAQSLSQQGWCLWAKAEGSAEVRGGLGVVWDGSKDQLFPLLHLHLARNLKPFFSNQPPVLAWLGPCCILSCGSAGRGRELRSLHPAMGHGSGPSCLGSSSSMNCKFHSKCGLRGWVWSVKCSAVYVSHSIEAVLPRLLIWAGADEHPVGRSAGVLSVQPGLPQPTLLCRWLSGTLALQLWLEAYSALQVTSEPVVWVGDILLGSFFCSWWWVLFV